MVECIKCRRKLWSTLLNDDYVVITIGCRGLWNGILSMQIIWVLRGCVVSKCWHYKRWITLNLFHSFLVFGLWLPLCKPSLNRLCCFDCHSPSDGLSSSIACHLASGYFGSSVVLPLPFFRTLVALPPP